MLAPSVSVLDKGANRIGFALFDTAGKQLSGAGVALYVGNTDGSAAHGPYLARSESLKVSPQFESKQTATDPDSARGVYVADVPFKRNGKFAMLGDRPARRAAGGHEPDLGRRSAARRSRRPPSGRRRRSSTR